MNKMQEQVALFHHTMHLPVATRPTIGRGYDRSLRVSLIREEAREFEVACSQGDLVEMTDALADLLYVTFGAAVTFGIDIEPVFDAVQLSNMTKGGGGMNAEGKLLKPATWVPPDITHELKVQIQAPAGLTYQLTE